MKILNLPFAKNVWYWMVPRFPKFCCRLLYTKAMGGGKILHLNHPRDLNEKLHWLKFHEDMEKWALLADKYRVRSYVEERGLGDILVKLYGQWDNVESLKASWDSLPKKFVLKTNNGSGTVMIIEDKPAELSEDLCKRLDVWLKKKDIGIGTVEPHYCLIKPCLIAEELLEDNSVSDYSQSLLDYKIWSFDGKPSVCMLVYDRNIDASTKIVSFYDLDWNEHPEWLKKPESRHPIPRPKNWERMLEIASILSKGHPEMRVDLYNIDGRIYFGELTMTSEGGFNYYYAQELLDSLGRQITVC